MDFDSLPAELQAKTDAEIAALIPMFTPNPIAKSKVRRDLMDKKLAYSISNDWGGPIADLRSSGSVPQALKDGLELFFGFLDNGDDAYISTDGEQYAVETWQIMQGLKAIAPVVGTFTFTDEDIDNFYSFGGTRIWKDETEATIAAARQKLADENAFDWKLTYIRNHYLDTPERNKDETTLTANLRAAADWMESQ